MRKALLPIMLLGLWLPSAVTAGSTLESAYRDVLAGDYDAARATVVALADQGGETASVARLKKWLDRHDEVIAARKDVKRQTFEWNVDQARKALEQDETYVALTFAARAAAYALTDDPMAGVDPNFLDRLAQRGRAAAEAQVAENHWAKAAGFYAMLARILPDDEEIDELRDRANRHARLELLYDDEEELKRRIDGASYDLLHSVVRLIERNYFKQPDYRRAVEGALEGLVACCETSKLYDYLDGVANPASRDYFLAELRKLKGKVAEADRFDYYDFLRLYKQVERASDKSIELPEGLLVVEFLDGALEELDDFTAVVWPVDAPEFEKVMMGGFEGVGIQLGKDEYTKRLRVVTPLENSPAIEAGIQAGDLIVEVDGKSTRGWSTDDAVRNIMGKAGTDVTLTMFRPSVGKRIDFTLTRRDIVLRTVRGVERLDDGRSQDWNYILDEENGVAYLSLTQFLSDSVREVEDALEQARKQGMKSLVLDLRGNPGGFLHVAIELVSLFVERGDVVSTDGQNERRETHKVTGRAPYADLPLVVLVNEGSASASEIFAGALQDHNRAIVLGDRTFGKGSVQRVLQLGPDARLKLTTALYYLPSGRTPHKQPDAEAWGVDPDQKLKLNPKEYARVIEMARDRYIIKGGAPGDDAKEDEDAEQSRQAALDELSEESEDDEESLLTEADVEWLESDPIKVPDQDPQLETALLLLRVKLAAELPWPRDLAARAASEPQR